MHPFVSAAEEELVDVLSLDDYLLSNRSACFLVKIEGNSMINAGIMPKDLVVLERGRKPINGDVVVIDLNGQSLMKIYENYAGQLKFVAGNGKDKPLVPEENLKIYGVVTGVIRKYH